MKLALQFPHIVYREGPAAVAQVALNGSVVYIAGAQNADALCADLERIHDRIRAEVGQD